MVHLEHHLLDQPKEQLLVPVNLQLQDRVVKLDFVDAQSCHQPRCHTTRQNWCSTAQELVGVGVRQIVRALELLEVRIQRIIADRTMY
jgi:hypothetical protein